MKPLEVPENFLIQFEKGDFEGFLKIFKKNYEILYMISFNRLHNKVLVEDALQDVLAHFFKLLPNGQKAITQTVSKFESVLVNIVKNKSIDVYRKESKKETQPLHEFIPFLKENSHSENHQRLLDKDELIVAADSVLNRVGYQVFLMYWDGHDDANIEEQLKLEKGKVRVIKQRIKRRLRRELLRLRALENHIS